MWVVYTEWNEILAHETTRAQQMFRVIVYDVEIKATAFFRLP
jgi:hypothetical protein